MKFTNNMLFFFLHVLCVDVVMDFAMNLVLMIHHKKYTCLQPFNFLISVHSIHKCIFYP
jgi:hypothetical protein